MVGALTPRQLCTHITITVLQVGMPHHDGLAVGPLSLTNGLPASVRFRVRYISPSDPVATLPILYANRKALHAAAFQDFGSVFVPLA